MPITQYRVEGFRGIDQSKNENTLGAGYSPEAYNVETENGDIAVAAGYIKHVSAPIPGTGRIWRLMLWQAADTLRLIAATADGLYHWNTATEAWDTLYTYASAITSNDWDYEELRIGSTDYLIIANGQTQLVKWSGSGAAELFGSGLYVHETTIASFTTNMARATAASYTEASGIGTYALTMPGGWAYSANALIAFEVPAALIVATVIKITAGGNTHTANYAAPWLAGDIAVVKLVSTTACEIDETVYGIDTVTLTAAIPTAQKQRALDVGVQLNGVEYAVSSINTAGTVITLENPCTDTLVAAQTAKVRGGVSDIAVSFLTMHFYRLMAAGDAAHPSRLYWSQPPGDTRTVEDWSMDNVSADLSGGYMDIGQTSSDPIVGLYSMPTQLLIFKHSSLYRMIGDRPSNYTVLHINQYLEKMVHTGCASYNGLPYWLTRAGMYYYDGQTARLSGAARQVQGILANANLSECKACMSRDRLYFTIKQGNGAYDDAIIVFNMRERTHMLRKGFSVIDINASDGVMYMVNENRYVYQFGAGTDYDGDPIAAYWRTPKTDLAEKTISKGFRELYARGSGELVIRLWIDGASKEYPLAMPKTTDKMLRQALKNSGRTFYLEIENRAGNQFKLIGGVEIVYEHGGD